MDEGAQSAEICRERRNGNGGSVDEMQKQISEILFENSRMRSDSDTHQSYSSARATPLIGCHMNLYEKCTVDIDVDVDVTTMSSAS